MNKSQKKILVVDDDEMLRDMHATVFEDEGYLVGSASDGHEAWSLITTQHFDLLVTDMFMPNLNGFELTLKCHKEFPELKIILVSGGGKDIIAEHGQRKVQYMEQEVEIDAFLKKPFNLDDMLSIVERILQE